MSSPAGLVSIFIQGLVVYFILRLLISCLRRLVMVFRTTNSMMMPATRLIGYIILRWENLFRFFQYVFKINEL